MVSEVSPCVPISAIWEYDARKFFVSRIGVVTGTKERQDVRVLHPLVCYDFAPPFLPCIRSDMNV